MRLVPLLTALLLACLALAGCGGSTPPTQGTKAVQPIEAGKGAIAGLVIDDRYRPIPDAEVLLLPNGLTTVADGEGQFAFTGLDPGTYELRVNAKDHEAAPTPVEVVEGQYADAEVQARRILSDNGHVITTQYSVFIPCAADYVTNGIILDCLDDASGDSWRPGFTTDVTRMGANLTYLVTEAKVNQKGDYDVQARAPGNGDRYAVGTIAAGTYIKMVNQYGVKNEKDDAQHRNVPWNNTKPFDTLLFINGQARDTFNPISGTTCNPDVDQANRDVGSPVRTCNWGGVGVQFAIKATFIQSLFVGPPTEDVEQYHTLSE